MFLIVFLTGNNCCHWPEVGAKNRILDNILLIDKSALQDPHRPIDRSRQTETGHFPGKRFTEPPLPYTLAGHPNKVG